MNIFGNAGDIYCRGKSLCRYPVYQLHKYIEAQAAQASFNLQQQQDPPPLRCPLWGRSHVERGF